MALRGAGFVRLCTISVLDSAMHFMFFKNEPDKEHEKVECVNSVE